MQRMLERIRANLRAPDLTGRWDGEECPLSSRARCADPADRPKPLFLDDLTAVDATVSSRWIRLVVV